MSRSKKIIIGNWKMNPATVAEARQIFRNVSQQLQERTKGQTTAILCPPFVYLEESGRFLAAHWRKNKESKKKNTNSSPSLFLGVQNFSAQPLGAQTGEISGELLKQFGVTHVIIGHSERRALGESDELINKKILAALAWRFKVIICVGEKTRTDDGEYLAVIKEQVERALAGVPKEQLRSVTIAYEPVWAIGAASAMSPSLVHEMIIFIKKTLFDLYKAKTISVPILYGGSVDPVNAKEILTVGSATGLLIGRQSLDPKAFGDILAMADSLK